jgi:hypothetical protein
MFMRIILLFIFFISGAQLVAQNKSDSVAIVEVLVSDYKTMGNWDIKRHVQNCTDKYLLIENGEIWDMEKEKQYYVSNAHRIKIARISLT